MERLPRRFHNVCFTEDSQAPGRPMPLRLSLVCILFGRFGCHLVSEDRPTRPLMEWIILGDWLLLGAESCGKVYRLSNDGSIFQVLNIRELENHGTEKEK